MIWRRFATLTALLLVAAACVNPPRLAVSIPKPDTSDGGIALGVPANGGLTVSEALNTTATGVLAVQGFIVEDESGAKLCEALAESFPPQCGGPSVPVSGFEEVIDVPLENSQGVTWTDQSVILFGKLINGTFVVDPQVSG